MALGHIDPDEVEAFARHLQQFTDATAEGLARVGHHLRELGGSSWTDARYAEYEAMFAEIERLLHRACEELAGSHVPHLHGEIERARNYLNA